MLSIDPVRIMAEQRAQKAARDERLVGALELVQRYPGAWWDRPPGPDQAFDSENAGFEYLAFAMSQLVWANPRWRLTTRRPRAQEMVAEAIQFGMNRWTVDSDLKTACEDLAVDYCFAWGVAHTTPVPRLESYEAEDPIMWPQVSRLSPCDFGWDHRAPSFRRARMQWHEYRVDKEDLIERARVDRERPREQREGWILANIDQLQETSPNDHRSTLWPGGMKEPGGDVSDREQVAVLEVFLPGHMLPGKPGPADGFNGTILTLGLAGGSDGTPVELKPPRPFFGPRWGPYTLIGAYIVPDCPYPLSALVATAGHIEQASRLSKAVDAQVEAYKRLMLVGSQVPELAQRIKDGKNDHVYYMRQLAEIDKHVRQYEIGGTTPGNVAAEQRAINKRNRALGMDEVQRGNVTGEGTATEVQLAVEASLGRQGYIKGRFQDGVRRVGRTVAWYLYHLDSIEFPLGPEAIEALELPDGAEAFFEGGGFDGSGASFDDLGLEIEPYSMERPSETFLRQRGELLANVIQLAPSIAMLQQVGGDPKGILDAYGDSYGMPKLSGLFPGIASVDPSVVQALNAEPRLGRDTARGFPAGGVARGGGGRAPGPQSTLRSVGGGGSSLAAALGA